MQLVVPCWQRLVLEYTFGVYVYLVMLISMAVGTVIFMRMSISQCDTVLEWKHHLPWTDFT